MADGIADEGVLRKLVQHMNAQVPRSRRSLAELLRDPDPCYAGHDGREYVLATQELALIDSVLKELGVLDIKLPIVMFADSEQSMSVWRVEGEIECAVIAKVLDKPHAEGRAKLHLYGPHMSELRRKLPTTTVAMLMP